MKPKIKLNHWIFKLPFMGSYSAMVLGRFILLKAKTKDDVDTGVLYHEMVHQRQMDEHGVLKFYYIYISVFLKKLWYYKSWRTAYHNIPFEIQAYGLTETFFGERYGTPERYKLN